MGEGGLARLMERTGIAVSAVEPGLLKRNGGWVPSRGRVWRTTAEQASLPDGAFDLVVAVHVLEHLNDLDLVFRKCHRALRPGGSLYLVTPNAQSLGIPLFGAHCWNFEDPTHRRFFSPRSLGLMLRKVGFQPGWCRRLRLDSLSIEPSSLVRALRRTSAPNGVLASPVGRLSAAVLLPITLGVRLFLPGISPSFEMWAHRG